MIFNRKLNSITLTFDLVECALMRAEVDKDKRFNSYCSSEKMNEIVLVEYKRNYNIFTG